MTISAHFAVKKETAEDAEKRNRRGAEKSVSIQKALKGRNIPARW
jgi:hypothetical protein